MAVLLDRESQMIFRVQIFSNGKNPDCGRLFFGELINDDRDFPAVFARIDVDFARIGTDAVRKIVQRNLDLAMEIRASQSKRDRFSVADF